MVELNRISSRYRIRSPDLYFTVSPKPDNESSSPFLLLQMIQVFLLMSRISFCFYKIVYRLKLDRAAFDDVVQSLVQTMVTPSPITKQSDLFKWIQVAVLLSYIITAAVFVYYVVQETHLPIPMAILCVDLGFQFGHSVLICLWLLVEMIGVGSVYYLIWRKKMIRKNVVSFL